MISVKTEWIREKLYQTMESCNKEMKQCRDYGTGHLLYHSEVHLIVAIFKHPEANASELAQALGITNGAVTQVANKLSKKGLIDKYKLNGNKKDTYFRLTEQGEQVYWGHERHHEKIYAMVKEYLDSLEQDQINAIITFLDKMIEGVPRD